MREEPQPHHPPVETAEIPPIERLRASNVTSGTRLLDAVERYFERYGRPGPGSRILTAVSGGPDSTALLAVLAMLARDRRWTIAAAHVNYRWRGVDSELDEAHCQRLATSWGMAIHADYPVLEAKSPVNRQVWARQARYDFFSRLAEDGKYDHVAVGHQRDDQAETVAAAVLDAAGTFALGGIPPVRGKIIRPLFYCDRETILEFLHAFRVPYRIDRSNFSGEYQRNRIRQDVLPAWRLHNPSIASGLARLGEQLAVQNRYLESEADRLLGAAEIAGGPGRIVLDAGALISYDPALDPFVLRAICRHLGATAVPTPATVERFGNLRRGGGSQRIEQGVLMIERSKGRMVATFGSTADAKPQAGILDRPGTVRFEQITLAARPVPPPASPRFDDHKVVFLDADSIAGTMQVRSMIDGDRYRPIRFHGHKKLADLFADSGVPSSLRRHIPILTDGSGVLWPVGFPVADRARLKPDTRAAVEITVTFP
ncbi:MAG: tRNA lysidine(34) synthetase TilS [Candidatus Zixiibacteriota bacterium]